MTKIYTRTGDGGETGLSGTQRVRKDDLQVEAIGTVDELNAALGVVLTELLRSGAGSGEIAALVEQIQHQLFELGAELASPAVGADTRRIGDRHVGQLEAAIDRHETQLAPLDEFILPGGAPAAAQLHLARCICRRAERRLVALVHEGAQSAGEGLRYLNRLGDLLFVLARAANRAAGVADVAWRQDR